MLNCKIIVPTINGKFKKVLFFLILIFCILSLFHNKPKNSIFIQQSNVSHYYIVFFNNSKTSNATYVWSLSSPDLGYANRVYNVLTALTISLLTNSVCLIKFDGLDGFIDLPIYNASYEPGAFLEVKPRQSWLYKKDLNILMNTKMPEGFSNLVYKDNAAYFFEICSNPNIYQKLLDANLVNATTVEKALTNKNQKNVLQIGYEVGGNLLNRMWKLNPNKLLLVHKYVNETFEKQNFLIGMHMRSGYLDDSEIQRFIKCAFYIESNVLNKTKGISWFVASDIPLLVDSISEKYPQKNIITTNGTAIHTAFILSDNLEKALLDIELLSLCDEIITTGGSTFGFLAAMKSMKLPYYINGKRGKTNRCEKMELDRPSSTPNNFAVF